MRTTHSCRDNDHDEDGTTLILAVVFVLVIAVVLVAVGSLAANSLLTTSNARVQRTSTGDADSAVTIAMQYVRYQPPGSCGPSGASIPSSDPRSTATNTVQVYCTEQDSLLTLTTRIVDFYACPSGATQAACTATNGPALLHAEVTYDDLNGGNHCTTTSTTTVTASCGIEMSVDFWDFGTGADT